MSSDGNLTIINFISKEAFATCTAFTGKDNNMFNPNSGS